MTKPFNLTHIWYPKLQDLSLTIKWFSVISMALVGWRFYPSERCSLLRILQLHPTELVIFLTATVLLVSKATSLLDEPGLLAFNVNFPQQTIIFVPFFVLAGRYERLIHSTSGRKMLWFYIHYLLLCRSLCIRVRNTIPLPQSVKLY